MLSVEAASDRRIVRSSIERLAIFPRSSGYRCPLRSSVMVAVLWPMRACRTLMLAPHAIRQQRGGVAQRMRCHGRKLGCDGLPGLVYFLLALCAGRRLSRPDGRVERPPQSTQRHPAPMPRRKHQILAVAAGQLCREQRCKKPRDWDRAVSVILRLALNKSPTRHVGH
jgi:hypothetical protein